MPRPRGQWRVRFAPPVTYFKPRGVPLATLSVTTLTTEEVEALRLKHVERLQQRACAEHMGMSQPTFHRLLTSAHEKVSTAVVRGTAIALTSPGA